MKEVKREIKSREKGVESLAVREKKETKRERKEERKEGRGRERQVVVRESE